MRYFYNRETKRVVELNEEGLRLTVLTELFIVDPTEQGFTDKKADDFKFALVNVPSKKEKRAYKKSSSGSGISEKTEQIKELILKGEMKPQAIADEVGSTVANIYVIKSHMKKAGELHVEKKKRDIDLSDDEPFGRPAGKSLKTTMGDVGREQFYSVKKLQEMEYNAKEAAETSGVLMPIVNRIFNFKDYESFCDSI